MKKRFCAGLATGLFLIGMVGMAKAIPIELNWTTTAIEFTDSFFGVGVVGEVISTTITVDNGGLTTLSQSWYANDFLSYRIEGATGWWIESNDISSTNFGKFSTDGLGEVITAGNWRGNYAAGGKINVSWGPVLDGGWWNNGKNEVVGSENPYGGINVANVGDNKIGSNWVANVNAPVPEPATMLLFGTGLVGLVGSRLRKKKK